MGPLTSPGVQNCVPDDYSLLFQAMVCLRGHVNQLILNARHWVVTDTSSGETCNQITKASQGTGCHPSHGHSLCPCSFPMANGALCTCHESEVPVDIFPGSAKQSDPVAALPPPRLSHLLAEGGCSLSIKGWSFHILDAGPPNAGFSLAADTFLELVIPFTNPFSMILADLGSQLFIGLYAPQSPTQVTTWALMRDELLAQSCSLPLPGAVSPFPAIPHSYQVLLPGAWQVGSV